MSHTVIQLLLTVPTHGCVTYSHTVATDTGVSRTVIQLLLTVPTHGCVTYSHTVATDTGVSHTAIQLLLTVLTHRCATIGLQLLSYVVKIECEELLDELVVGVVEV